MSQNKRLEYIDVCKGIGIILVILGHTYYCPKKLYNLIYCFHMPLFFILSGFTYNKDRNNDMEFKLFVKKKAKQLLLPYFVFAMVNMFLQIMWKQFIINETIDCDYLVNNLKGIVLCYSNMQHMPNCSPIWFLLCLFIAFLLFYWLMKMKDRYALFFAIVSMMICYYLSTISHRYTDYPFKFPVFLMGVFFMIMGYFLRCMINKNGENNTNLAVCIIILLCACSIELISDNALGMNENNYGNIVLFLITSIPISYSLIILSKHLCKRIECRFFAWLGRNTMYVVGFNYFCRDLATELYYLIPIIRTYVISYIPLFVITFILCLLCILICNGLMGVCKTVLK